MRIILNACIHIHVLIYTIIVYISLAAKKKTSKARLFVPPHCTPAIVTRREQGAETEFIDMEKFSDESLYNTDHELHENTLRPKKLKRQD